MKPMLAHRFPDHHTRITYPTIIQPKLNGIRGIYNSSIFQSRDEIIWKDCVLEHLTKELSKAVPEYIILDGELYVHGWSLQRINKLAGVNRLAPAPLTNEIEYHVFDMVDTMQPQLTFLERSERLQILCSLVGSKKVKFVETRLLGQAEAEQAFHDYRIAGYEGTMYRDPDSPYGLEQNCGNKENRWKHLLKRKLWMDGEFEIVNFQLTTGDKGFPGFQLTCITPEGNEFNVGSGMSSSEVQSYANNPPIGRLAKVKYYFLSDALIPLNGTLEVIL